MSFAQSRIGAAEVRPKASPNPVRLPAAALLRAASLVGRSLVGSGGGPREYPRQGFPEHELHQILAGRQDRFDGLT